MKEIIKRSINLAVRLNNWTTRLLIGQYSASTIEERRIYLKRRFAKFEYSAWLSFSIVFFMYSMIYIFIAFSESKSIDPSVGYRLIFSLIGFAIIVLSGNLVGMPPISAVLFLVLDKILQIGRSEKDTISRIRDDAKIDFLSSLNPREFQSYLIWVSENIANQASRKSNVYLIIGIIIAFAGLLIFYARIILASSSVDNSDKWAYIVQYVPTGSALFFVEFVAFFFLRQSRNISDEYRHFEAVRRKREENLLLLKMFSESSYLPAQDVLKSMEVYTGLNTIKIGETTELASLRRKQIDELSFFADFVRAARGREEDRKSRSTSDQNGK